jgi:hypothetical protein
MSSAVANTSLDQHTPNNARPRLTPGLVQAFHTSPKQRRWLGWHGWSRHRTDSQGSPAPSPIADPPTHSDPASRPLIRRPGRHACNDDATSCTPACLSGCIRLGWIRVHSKLKLFSKFSRSPPSAGYEWRIAPRICIQTGHTSGLASADPAQYLSLP